MVHRKKTNNLRGVASGDTAQGIRNEKIEKKLDDQQNFRNHADGSTHTYNSIKYVNGQKTIVPTTMRGKQTTTSSKWVKNDNGTYSYDQGSDNAAYQAKVKRGMVQDDSRVSMAVGDQTGVNKVNAEDNAAQKNKVLRQIAADPNSANVQDLASTYGARSRNNAQNAGVNPANLNKVQQDKNTLAGKEVELTTKDVANATKMKSDLLHDKNGNMKELNQQQVQRIQDRNAVLQKNNSVSKLLSNLPDRPQAQQNAPVQGQQRPAPVNNAPQTQGQPVNNVQQGQPQQNVQQRPVVQQNTQPVQQQRPVATNNAVRPQGQPVQNAQQAQPMQVQQNVQTAPVNGNAAFNQRVKEDAAKKKAQTAAPVNKQ